MQILALGLVLAGMTSRTPAAEVREADLESRVGQPADIAASAYLYRCDRPADENPPEIWLLLAQHAGLPLDKPVDAGAPAVKRVLCGLLWEEPRPIERVELTWPKDAKAVPRPEDVVVRWLPHGNSSSWWSRRAAGPGPLSVVTAESPQVAGDGRTYVYTLNATGPTTAADNLVVVLKDGVNPPAEPFAAPTVRVITPEPWKLVEFEIEWGFQDATQNLAFDGRIEAYNGVLGAAAPLPGDTATTMTGDSAWQSKPAAEKGTGPICRNGPEGASHKLDLSPFPPPAGNTRRGIRVSMLYLGTTQNTTVWRQQARVEDANRTIVTVRTGSGSFSFLPADLQTGPILAPEFGFFVRALRERQAAPPASGTREVPAPQNLLTEKVDAIAGGPGVRGWGSNDTPWFGANPAREPVTVSTFTLPAAGRVAP